VEGDLSAIDGKSLGCKMLHASFVPENDSHCAHVSFKKQKDNNGLVKCQKTKETAPESLFTQDMLDYFANVAVNKYGFDPELLYDPSPDEC
jgi:hypothetical protein